MVYALILHESRELTERLKSVYKNNSKYSFYITCDCEDALKFAEDHRIAVAFLSLSLPVMNGNEVADILSNKDPDTRYIFYYREIDIDIAIDMFNAHGACRIIKSDVLNADELSVYIKENVDEYLFEDVMSEKERNYIEKESAYRKKSGVMNAFLDDKKQCLFNVCDIYAYTFSNLLNGYDNVYLNDFFEIIKSSLKTYIDINLYNFGITGDFGDICIKEYDKPDEHKYFKMILNDSGEWENANVEFLFCIRMICSVYYKLSDAVRGKAEIDIIEHKNKASIIFDLKYSKLSAVLITLFESVIMTILDVLMDKSDSAIKDGIIQFRFAKYIGEAE